MLEMRMMLDWLSGRENLLKASCQKLYFDGVEVSKERLCVVVLKRKPNILFPVLPKLLFVMNQSANLIKQIPGTRNDKIGPSSFRGYSSLTDKLLPIIYPINVRVLVLPQDQVLCVIIRRYGVHEFSDMLVLGIVSVHSILLRGCRNRVFDNPVRQSALSYLRDKMPMRFVVRAIGSVLRLMRPMPNTSLVSLADKWAFASGAKTFRNISITTIPNGLT